jgi:hypothetical protein
MLKVLWEISRKIDWMKTKKCTTLKIICKLLFLYLRESFFTLKKRAMKTPTSKVILALLASTTLCAQAETPAANSASGKPIVVSGWTVIGDKTQAFGPKEEGVNIVFSGSGFGDKGKNEAAFFPKTELAIGDSLELSAKVTFSGVSGMGNFRFGIYQKRSKDHPRGWMGYTAYAGIDKKFPKGGLFASETGNDINFDTATNRVLGESQVPFKNIKDGTYLLNMKLTRSNEGIVCEASMTVDGDPNAVLLQYTGNDTSPATTSFDALGFSTHQLLSADSISFSEVSVNLIAP